MNSQISLDEQSFTLMDEKALYSLVDDKLLQVAPIDYNEGYLVIISNSLTVNLLKETIAKALEFNVECAFLKPFNYCGNDVLIAKTNAFNKELNQQLKEFEGKADLVHVKNIPSLNKTGVVLLDMDSTCIQIECIDEIAKAYGVGEEIAKITSEAMHGKLDFKQSLRKRVSLLKGASTQILDDVRNNLPIMPGFKELVALLQNHGWKVAIASGGFMPFVNKLKEDFNLTLVRANTFEIENDLLTGQLIGEIVDSNVKVQTLNELCTTYNIPLEQSIAIGDGANDLPMIFESGLGFAIHAKPVVRAQAPATINNFGLDAAACILEAKKRLELSCL
jgi:phosphoserine phosphatase